MKLPHPARHAEPDGILEAVPGTVEDIHRATEDPLRSASAAAATSGRIREATEPRGADSVHALSTIRVRVGHRGAHGSVRRRRVAPRRAAANPVVVAIRATR